MKNVLIVTMCDAGYYSLVRDLIASIRGFYTNLEVNIGVIDTGMTTDQVNTLRDEEIRIARACWNFPWTPRVGIRRKFLSMLSRPFIPSYFPDYDFFVYLDGDTWVQDQNAIIDLLRMAQGSDVALIPEIHASFIHLYSDSHPLRKIHSHAYQDVYKEYGDAKFSAVLNSGVFAAKRESRIWHVWQNHLGEAMERRISDMVREGIPLLDESHPSMHLIEQNALNAAFRANAINIAPLSPIYNWICTLAMPKLDTSNGFLVEPIPPYTPLKVIHLTWAGRQATTISDLQGRQHNQKIVYSDWIDRKIYNT